MLLNYLIKNQANPSMSVRKCGVEVSKANLGSKIGGNIGTGIGIAFRSVSGCKEV